MHDDDGAPAPKLDWTNTTAKGVADVEEWTARLPNPTGRRRYLRVFLFHADGLVLAQMLSGYTQRFERGTVEQAKAHVERHVANLQASGQPGRAETDGEGE